MTRALVIGLLPAQAHRVRQAVGHRYRLRFVESASAQRIRHVPEVTVLVVSYLNHSAIQKVQALDHREIHYIYGRDREVIACLENRS